MEYKVGEQRFHFDKEIFFEHITKAVTNTGEKLFVESKFTEKSVEQLSESLVHARASKFLNKNGVIDTSLNRTLVNLSVGQNKSQFCLNDDLDSDGLKKYIIKREKYKLRR